VLLHSLQVRKGTRRSEKPKYENENTKKRGGGRKKYGGAERWPYVGVGGDKVIYRRELG
jgi:hypothetical protein